MPVNLTVPVEAVRVAPLKEKGAEAPVPLPVIVKVLDPFRSNVLPAAFPAKPVAVISEPNFKTTVAPTKRIWPTFCFVELLSVRV